MRPGAYGPGAATRRREIWGNALRSTGLSTAALLAFETAALCLGVLGIAASAHAAPTLNIRGAALRLVVVPEARSDIVITLERASNRLPIRVRRFGKTTFVTGDIGHRTHSCQSVGPRRGVGVWGRGSIAYDDLPRLVARTPMNVNINAGDAVFGDVGRSDSLDLTSRGCGGWTVGNVAGRMRINQAGSGDTRAGAAGEADLSVAGPGDINLQAVRGGVTAVSSGSGNIAVASLQGPFNARIAGSGDVRVKSGAASDVNASIAGSGGVGFGGVARALRASIAGSGDVTVARVDGPVVKHVFGTGQVSIGR